MVHHVVRYVIHVCFPSRFSILCMKPSLINRVKPRTLAVLQSGAGTQHKQVVGCCCLGGAVEGMLAFQIQMSWV